jgi:hypothetical protein
MKRRALAGRTLISLIAVQTGVGSFFFDFTDSHVFNDHWSPHARFHGAMGVFLGAGMSLLSLWYTWRKAGDARTNLQVGAWFAALYFMSFFPSALVPGAGFSDPDHPVPMVGGLSPQAIEGGISLALVVLGYALARASTAPSPSPVREEIG